MLVLLDTFHLVDLLFCSVMVLQSNTELFMEREPYFGVLNNQQGKLINSEEKPQPRNCYSIYLFYLNLKYSLYIPYIGDAFSKNKKNLQCSKQMLLCKHYMTFFFSKKKKTYLLLEYKCYVPWFCC